VLLDLDYGIIGLSVLEEGKEAVFGEGLFIVFGLMIEDVDAGWNFGGVGGDFDSVDKSGLVEGDGDDLGVVAEAFGLPRGVFGEEVGGGVVVALAGI
jgi:hypothetical protein